MLTILFFSAFFSPRLFLLKLIHDFFFPFPQVLNDHTQQLQRLRAAGLRLHEEIRARAGLLQRLVDETTSVEEQRRGAQESNAKLRKMIESHRVAPVLEYVKESAAQSALTREVASMERKVR